MEKVLDYYAVLDLGRDLTPIELRKQLKSLANKWAGRTNGSDAKIKAEAEYKQRICGEALAILKTDEDIKNYNAKLLQWQKSSQAGEERKQSEQRAATATESAIDPETLVSEGWALLEAGNVHDALYVATRAKQKFPTHFGVLVLLGEAYLRWDELDEALAAFRSAVRIEPNNSELYAAMGRAYEKKQSWKEAYEQYRKASTIDPQNVSHKASMGLVCTKADAPDEGIPILRECLKQEPGRKDVQWCLAVALIESARQGWTYVPPGHPRVEEGYYAMNRQQALQAIEKMREAASLEHDDLDLAKEIIQIKADVERNIGRVFTGNWWTLGMGCFLYIFLNGVGVLLAAAYYFASRTPQYSANREALEGVGAMRQKIAEIADSNQNGIVALIMAVVWAAAFPIIVVVNGLKNYTGENAPIALDTPSSKAPETISQVQSEPERMESSGATPTKPSSTTPVEEIPVVLPVTPRLAPVPPPSPIAQPIRSAPEATSVLARFCTECGAKSDTLSKFCSDCGSTLST